MNGGGGRAGPTAPPLAAEEDDEAAAAGYPTIRVQQQQHQQHQPPPFSLPGGAQLYESPRAGTDPFHRILIGNSSSGSGGRANAASANGNGNGRAAADPYFPPSHHHYQPSAALAPAPGLPAAGRRRDVTYGARAPIRRDVSWLATAILLAYVGALAFYGYVRVAMLLPSSGLPHRWYSALIFAIELLGATAVLPYAVVNTRHLHAAGSPGLPADDGASVCTDCPFHVRVLVCCYGEPLDVVAPTVAAALDALLPPSAQRSVYLCDDGSCRSKRAWIEATYGTSAGAIHPPAAPDPHPRALPRALGVGTAGSLAAAARFPGRDAVFYVSGRAREPGETNGKSNNLNHCLKNVIYKNNRAAAGPPHSSIPPSEVVVVLDADMVADPDFFLKLLEPMTDPALALCLTPQGYINVFPPEDIFNTINKQWWQYSLPGLAALGYVACTGTNFCIRARALAAVGWFPTYTITEDFALGMNLAAAGFRGTYLNSYLARGEAPTELRNIFRQRSRWAKGHFQLSLSRRNPLFRRGLSPLQRLLYNNGTWAYVVTVVTTPAFVLVPFLSVFANLDPVRFGGLTPLALTLYLSAGFAVQSYAHTPLDSQALWMATLSNQLLAFTYLKAMTSVFLSKLGVKKKPRFKATTKGGQAQVQQAHSHVQAHAHAQAQAFAAPPPLAAVDVDDEAPPPASARMQAGLIAFGQSMTRRFGGGEGRAALSGGGGGGAQTDHGGGETTRAPTAKELITPPPKAKKRTEEDTLTEKCVFFLWACVCVCTITLALHNVILTRQFGWASALTCCWAVYNAVAPVLFFLSIWASTSTMTICAFWLQIVSIAASVVAIVSLWFVAPTPFSAVAASVSPAAQRPP